MLFSLYSIYFCILLYIYIHHGRGSNKKKANINFEWNPDIYLFIIIKAFLWLSAYDDGWGGSRGKERKEWFINSFSAWQSTIVLIQCFNLIWMPINLDQA